MASITHLATIVCWRRKFWGRKLLSVKRYHSKCRNSLLGINFCVLTVTEIFKLTASIPWCFMFIRWLIGIIKGSNKDCRTKLPQLSYSHSDNTDNCSVTFCPWFDRKCGDLVHNACGVNPSPPTVTSVYTLGASYGDLCLADDGLVSLGPRLRRERLITTTKRFAP